MTPSNLWTMLGIVIFLSLPRPSTAADESATAAQLTLRQQQLHAAFEDRLSAWVDAAIEEEGEALAVRMTALLRQKISGATRPDVARPRAMRALPSDPATTQAQLAGNTACSMVGRTLECVLRDLASP